MLEPTHDPVRGVAALGEALVLVSGAETHLAGAQAQLHLAGAEANLAAGLVAWGIPASFIGRLGDDEYGRLIRSELIRRGVDVSAVETDAARPTGHYRKTTARDDAGELRTQSCYTRSGSAASAMGPGFLDSAAVAAVLAPAAVVHCSGITPALSDSCLALMRRLLTDRPGVSGVVSFDVNWREQLWPNGDPAEVVALANHADIVLVGGDEAIRVLGTDDPQAIRRLLPSPATVVIKDGARQAIAVDRDGSTVAVPALRVEVVEPVGAGDAFAAGFLSGVVRAEDMVRCLRRGHLGAAVTLTTSADSAPPPAAGIVEQLLTCPETDWAAITVAAAGISAPEVSR